ncbi:MAG: C40 family peptidase [Bacteroidota bacterium]
MFSCKHHQKQTVTKAKTTQHTKPKQSEKKGSEGELVIQEKLGVGLKEIHHDKLLSFVNDWYGVPYKFGGCKKEGVDCSCFVCMLYETVYQTTLNRTAGEMFKGCAQISANEARQGDLFFFKINGDKISHVGVCLKHNFFVHASTSKGVMINSIEEAYYKKYFFCAGRIKKT